MEAVTPIVKASYKIDDASDAAIVLSTAIQTAVEEMAGPVVIGVPQNIFREKADFGEYEKSSIGKDYQYDDDKITEIVDILSETRNIGIFAGRGAKDASEEIMKLSEQFSAPVATTLSGRGIITEDHTREVGYGFGIYGIELAEEIFNRCDTIIAVGVKFSEMATSAWRFPKVKNLIHIDRSEEILSKNYNDIYDTGGTDNFLDPIYEFYSDTEENLSAKKISLCCDAKLALTKIIETAEGIEKEKNIDSMSRIKKAKEEWKQSILKQNFKGKVHPAKFLYELRQLIPADTLIFSDCGMHQVWLTTDFPIYGKDTFYIPADYQAMGFSIPAGIAAKIAHPQKKVIAICGDGCFQMTGFEVLTAVKEKANVMIIVFNDGAFGLIKKAQELNFNRSEANILNPDFKYLASAFGVDYVEINSNREISDKLQTALNYNNTVIVNVAIDYSNNPALVEAKIKNYVKRMKGIKKIIYYFLMLMRKR
ncbi:thiamine pyrophosphate-binding protein [Elusimicrobiota bacterium]